MEIFTALFFKLIPLYLIILLGFIAGKYLDVKKENLASLLIYIITPVIVFNGTVTTEINLSSLSLPILFFILSTVSCLVFYRIASLFWQDSSKNIMGYIAGTGNTGYFGLPVAYAIFSSDLIGLVVLSILGFILFESSLGFFITARGHHTAKESFVKLLKLPSIYAFFLGLVANLSGVYLGDVYNTAVESFRGAYTVLGMMIVGLGLSAVSDFRFDLKFIGLSFFIKFLWWPLLIALVIITDKILLHLYNPSIYRVMILMSIVPLAANTVAFASALKAQPEKSSVAVLLSTLFALVYIPMVVTFWME